MNPAMRRILLCILLVFTGAVTLAIPTRLVHAQTASAHELIQAVNFLRASYGLEAYTVDASLTAMAQQQSDYQASINKITHQRPDGSGPEQHGISSENVGGGYNASVQVVINRQWTDYWHQHTLIGYSSGRVGAGAATANGSVYFTFIVKNTGTQTGLPDAANPAATSASGAAMAATPRSTATPLITATPREDGSIVHLVQPGETVWSIALAYNVRQEDLVILNGLSPSNPVIYTGTKLLIRLKFTPTTTPTITQTPPPPTRTPLPTITRRPALATLAPPPTATLTPRPFFPEVPALQGMDRRTLGIVITIICGLGLLIAVTVGMRKKG
ncbi:MAG: LysM peptidoglycan-binding domain-containing protein [Anaerolineaceae bacterium]|nr:LysM peptidoglycan-binding domain-containing protein [Anaerolineaceae bacterium]